MIRLCRNVIETARAKSCCPSSVGLGVRGAAASSGGPRTPRNASRAFSPYRPALLGIYVMVVAGLARRTCGCSTRNGPPLAPSRYRFDLEVSISWLWRRGRPRIAVETRQLIHEMARANFLWGAPRIHGELLKLGITVSQATVSRYMPRSPKDRRSQAWRTFVRNHAIAMVQSRNFDGHSLARDLLSQVRSRSRIFTCRLSAFVVALATAPCAGLLGIGRSIPCCRSSPARLVFQNCNPGSQIQGAGAAIAAGYSQRRSFADRSNSRPTYPHTSSNITRTAHQCPQLVNVCLSTRSSRGHGTRLRQIAHNAKVPSSHPIATLGQPRIRSYLFEADMYAADVLRNDTCSGLTVPGSIRAWRLRNSPARLADKAGRFWSSAATPVGS